MDPAFPAAGTSRTGGRGAAGAPAEGGDETKYDSRHLRDRMHCMQRATIVFVVLLALGILMDDGILIRMRRRGRNSSALRRTQTEEVFAPAPVLDPIPVNDREAEQALDLSENGEREQQEGEGAQPNEEGTDAWEQGDNGGEGEGAGEGEGEGEGEEAGQGDGEGSGEGEGEQAGEGDGEQQQPDGEDAAPSRDVSWSLVSNAASCDGWFGNGFTKIANVVSSSGKFGGEDNDGERLQCSRHPHTNAVYCVATNLVVYPSRITMSRGGEDLSKVMGRTEDEELPRFSEKAFEIVTTPEGLLSVATAGGAENRGESTQIPGSALGEVSGGLEHVDGFKARMLGSTAVVGIGCIRECATIVREPTIFVTRVEYANLFHTSTDWWNTWQAARLAGLEPTDDYDDELLRGLTPEAAALFEADKRDHTRRIPAHVVFVDGHNAGPMDGGWLALFLSMNYIKHLKEGTCFERAIYAPYGYHAAISQGFTAKVHECAAQPHVRQFGEDFVRAFGLIPRDESTCGESPTQVLFVRRVHYLAHPRHNGQIVRRLDNEDEIFEALSRELMNPVNNMQLIEGLFSSMTMKEQVAAAQRACLIVGAHGAGLSHVLFAPLGVHMLELQTPQFNRPHFIAYSQWSGAHHHLASLQTSMPSPLDIINRIREAARQAAIDERLQGEAQHDHAA